VPVALGNTTPSSGCPASLLVRVIRCSLVIAVPLLRLLVSRAGDRADSADRDQETSPDESEHPKHCEHTKQRRNGGAGSTRIREFSRGQRLSAIGKVDPRRVALSSCSDTWCSRLQCAADDSFTAESGITPSRPWGSLCLGTPRAHCRCYFFIAGESVILPAVLPLFPKCRPHGRHSDFQPGV
jgi:hypothetical protein